MKNSHLKSRLINGAEKNKDSAIDVPICDQKDNTYDGIDSMFSPTPISQEERRSFYKDIRDRFWNESTGIKHKYGKGSNEFWIEERTWRYENYQVRIWYYSDSEIQHLEIKDDSGRIIVDRWNGAITRYALPKEILKIKRGWV